jgi:DNA repair protein RadA/Sms
VKTGIAAFGEIGLTGRLRPATQAERRMEECAKFSVSAVVGPQGTPERRGTQVLEADTLRRALALGLGDREEPTA